LKTQASFVREGVSSFTIFLLLKYIFPVNGYLSAYIPSSGLKAHSFDARMALNCTGIHATKASGHIAHLPDVTLYAKLRPRDLKKEF
jgi:hypothetical protein